MRRILWITILWALLPMRCAALDVLVNHVGYEPNSPKTVRIQRTSDYAGDGTFFVRRVSDGAQVYSGTLTRKGGLWDKFYWTGDFSALKTAGDYYVSATVNAENGTSFNFGIGSGVLINKTGKLVYQYFTAQRCGAAVSFQYVNRSGNTVTWSHNACHTDDGYIYPSGPQMDGVGGWHDAGDYGKYGHGFAGNPVFDLLWLYDSNRSYYDAIDTNSNGIADIVDEALWQARWLVKIVQANGHVMERFGQRRTGASWVKPENDTDRIIGNSDDRWIYPGTEATPQEIVVCASLIRMHRVLASKGLPTENFAQKALDIWNHRVALAISEGGHNNLGSAMHHVFAGIDLHAVYGLQNCWDRALQKVDEMSYMVINNPAFYDIMDYAEGPGYDLGVMAWFARTYPSEPLASNCRTAVQALMSRNMSYLACPIMGLVRRNEGGTLQYFPADPSLGINRLYGLLAWGAVEAYKTIGDASYLRFAVDQYDWILGANYHKVCMMEAAGDYHVDKYHTRYDTFVTNGIEPGVVMNGYIRSSSGLPWVYFGTGSASVQSNEGWLPNNSAYAMALAGLSILGDVTPPGVVTSFSASPSDGQMLLSWHNPSDSDFAATTIRVSTTGYPAGPTDGTLVVDKAGSPNSNDSHTHTGLTNGVVHFYSAFARDAWSNYSAAAHISGTTSDTTPPGPVANFTAAAGSGQVGLSWTNPADPDFARTMIRYHTNGYPAGPTDGALVVDRAAPPGSSDSYNHTGRVNGTTYYYSAFARDSAPNYAAAVCARATPSVLPLCLFEAFPYSNGNLNGTGGWTGSAANQIVVENNTAKVLGGATLYNSIQTISCSGSGGIVGVWAKAKKGVGDYTMWNLYIDDPAGLNLGRWYGKATSARGRIGGGGQVATSMNLTGGWDDLYVRIDFAANSSQFFFNGVSTGTLYHSETGAGDSVGRVRIERENNSSASGNYMFLDDVAVGVPDATAPTATIGAPSAPITKNGPVSFAVNFSEKVYGFDSASDIQLNSTGGATSGSVVVTGSGTGPYTVTLSNISGNGTLGITAKAAAANDVAGIGNTASAASATFKVVGNDGRISDIKDDANGSPVVLGGKALFLKQSTFGYIEEMDRTAGVRVEGAIAGTVGDLVCLSGVMATKTGGERYVNVDAMAACGLGSVDPFGLNNRALIDAIVCGLRVKAWGKVKPGSITANSYVLTDGSDTAGIRVITLGAPGVSENQFVTAVGAAGLDGVRVLYRE